MNHLWIIMDGNRRWAKSKFLPKLAWHKAWADNIERIVNLCIKKNINYLTMWALSTENLIKRDENEVKGIIKIINNLESYLDNMISKWLKFNIIWNINLLPESSQRILNNIIDKTKNNKWINLILGLAYWWQDEIIRATKKIIKAWLKVEEIDKNKFREFLDTWHFPIIDMIVRTWWDIRHSWFMLFDSEYSEYYFTEKKWPDFNEEELDLVIDQYNKSKRNFWK